MTQDFEEYSMSSMLSKLWSDDQGAVISVELILVLSILVFGIIPGLVAVRNAVNAALGTVGNLLTAITPNFTYSGFAITSTSGVNSPASVGGYFTSPVATAGFGDIQLAPVNFTNGIALSPAP